MSTTILAIDLGKFNSVLCWYEPQSRSNEFRTVKTTPSELRRELLRHPVERVVIEACSPAGWVHDLCVELNLVCDVANTAGDRTVTHPKYLLKNQSKETHFSKTEEFGISEEISARHSTTSK